MTRALILALATAVALLAAAFTAPVQADETDAKDKWAEHKGDLPFVVGFDKGMQQVKLTGKPPMYFFTATW